MVVPTTYTYLVRTGKINIGLRSGERNSLVHVAISQKEVGKCPVGSFGVLNIALAHGAIVVANARHIAKLKITYICHYYKYI